MCGRFTLSRSGAEIAEHFDLEDTPSLEPRWNVAPTQDVVTIRVDSEGARRLELRHWGLVPAWSDDASQAARMINARSETAASRPAFRDALRRRRCLVPADGFYEWGGARGRRIPRHIALPQGELFAMAGLYERFEGPGGRVLRSCTLLTTAANARMEPLHDRMPVILEPDEYVTWLERSERDGAALLDGLGHRMADALEIRLASPRVNDVRHEGADCLEPEEDPQLSLL